MKFELLVLCLLFNFLIQGTSIQEGFLIVPRIQEIHPQNQQKDIQETSNNIQSNPIDLQTNLYDVSLEDFQQLKNDTDLLMKQAEKVIPSNQDAQSFQFRSIHSFLNDAKYSSLKEVPIDQMTKREVEYLLVYPRQENVQQSFSYKHNRAFFFGYSKEMMQETAKAIAVENRWLFQEYDLAEIIVNSQ